MNVLILSVSAGGGHMKAAESLKKYIMLNDKCSKVEILDTLKYINPILDKFIIGSYIKSLKISPSLFGKLYNYTELDSSLSTVSNKVNKILAYRLLPFIKDRNPDVLVSTHPFPNEMLSILRLKYNLRLPAISIMTDYTPHNFWIHKGIDAFIVSNDSMKKDMVLRGVPEKHVYPFGIPVDPKFRKEYDKKILLKSLGLNPNLKTLLIMGGSLGIGKISEIYEELSRLENISFQIIIITGSNKKLYNEIIKLKDNCNKKTLLIGYTNEVHKYMKCCDLLITKPGGITITEALVCNIPMGLFSPIPGQEENNAKFLIENKVAINLEDYESYSAGIYNIFSQAALLNELKENCKKLSKPNSGNNIYNLMKNLKVNNNFDVNNLFSPN